MKTLLFISSVIFYFSLQNFVHAEESKEFNSTYYNQKPEEIETVGEIFRKFVNAMKRQLPNNYDNHSKVIYSDYDDHIYAVVPTECSREQLFIGEVSRVQVEDIIDEVVRFSCDAEKDGFLFYRRGQNIKPIDSEDLLHLKTENIIDKHINQLEVGDVFNMTMHSLQLDFHLTKKTENSITLDIRRTYENQTKVDIRFTKIDYSSEVHWGFEISHNRFGPLRTSRFLTISVKSLFYDDIYQHTRYFNGNEVVAFAYLNFFERFQQLIDTLAEKDAEFTYFVPSMF